MPSPPGDLTTLLSKLASSGVEFVLVGGLAAVAQGAPITTHDVDIVPTRTPENIDALLSVLASMNAKYRGRGEQVLRPTAALLGPGHSLLMTDLGPLDVLGATKKAARSPTSFPIRSRSISGEIPSGSSTFRRWSI